MQDSARKELVSTILKHFLITGKLNTPITSTNLLVKFISFKPPIGLLPSDAPTPTFRLTDLKLFESILDDLSQDWEHGSLQLSREARRAELCLLAADLGNGGLDLCESRKRKRVIDEDADSAAGDEPEISFEDHEHDSASITPLGGLNKELREVYAILQKGTAKGRLLAEQFRSQTNRFDPICPHITKEDCVKFLRSSTSNPDSAPCSSIHFRPLIRQHTDPALGHCSYLNTCYSEPTYAHSPSIPPFPGSAGSYANVNANQRGAISLPSGLGAGGRGKEKAPCRYLHFEVDYDGEDLTGPRGSGASESSRTSGPVKGKGRDNQIVKKRPHKLGIGLGPDGRELKVYPPQWINCDVRRFDYSVLGKFQVIMADPPWDIHMSLPYGTMTDDEMRAMPIPMLQDEGFLFLWVTGRAMEVGRECLRVWGYTRVDEVIWVKTNQLQRVIRTGRTGHWLNHTKEHMLVGVKTVIDPATGMLKFPSWANRGLDTDVIVSEVRETSRKPDEVYGMIERICPGGRKIEIFGRKHNTRPGWLTLGNQLGADQIYEEDLAARIQARYPERNVTIPTTGGPSTVGARG